MNERVAYYQIFSEDSSVRRKYTRKINSISIFFHCGFCFCFCCCCCWNTCNFKFNRKTRRHHNAPSRLLKFLWRMHTNNSTKDAPLQNYKAFRLYANQNMLNRIIIHFATVIRQIFFSSVVQFYTDRFSNEFVNRKLSYNAKNVLLEQ